MSHAQFLPWLFARASPTPTPSPSPSPSATLTSPEVIAAIVAAIASVLTLIGTVITQRLGRRATSQDVDKTLKAQGKQLNATFAEQRKQLNTQLEEQRKQLDTTLAAQGEQLDRTLKEQRTRTLNERFATAAEQLGNVKPAAVRLAGVYAMAGLADDWKENRQTCVDVLCGYLRLPYNPDPGEDANPDVRSAYERNREVSHTIIRVITAHLQADMAEAKSWRGLNFDFTGVVFDGGDFTYAEFYGGRVDFTGAVFSDGLVDFRSARFSGGVSFERAVFSGGTVDFSGAVLSYAHVSFSGARFSGADVRFFIASLTGGLVDFRSADDWSSPPRFPWGDTDMPPMVKVPSSKEDQSQT